MIFCLLISLASDKVIQPWILYATDCWRNAINNQSFVASVFLDFKKAFDCTNHSILLDKLHLYCNNHLIVNWFRHYLSGRKQRVKIEGVKSGWKGISIGVPQGSILGPLLFSLYVNDLPKSVLNSTVCMYSIFAISSSIQELNSILISDLNCIYLWLCSNRICLNLTKSVAMLICSKKKAKTISGLSIAFNGSMLKNVDVFKYLGVYVDQHLTWGYHIDKVVCKARSRLYALKRMLPLPPKVVALAFVLPCFDYCDVVWSPYTNELKNSIEKVHRKALKLIQSAEIVATLPPTMAVLREFHLAIQVFRCVNHLSPEYFYSTIEKQIQRVSSSSVYSSNPY